MMISKMSLKINGWRKIVKWCIWGVLGVLFLVFFIRVTTFEASYYSEKYGSERAAAQNNNQDDLI